MENVAGQEIVLGLYIKQYPDFNVDALELYEVQEKDGNLIAIDIEGNFFPIEDPGFYGRRRNHISMGAIDCFDLILIERDQYDLLKTKLVNSKKRTSKLLQMLKDNKANLSARKESKLRVIVNKIINGMADEDAFPYPSQ